MTPAAVRTVVAVSALAIAACLGGIWFPLDLEPGRSHAAGYHLNTLVVPAAGVAQDWYANTRTRAVHTRDGLRVVTAPGYVQILTRPLAIFANRCYAATVEYRLNGQASLRLAVMNEEATHVLAQAALAPGQLMRRTVHFETKGGHPVSMALLGDETASFILRSATLVPTSKVPCQT
jgi:hypothetical protein